MSAPGRRAFYILILLVILGSGTEIWASGTREDPMLEAEVLIEELKYNEAILILTDIMREHPDRFDEAQDLLNRIRDARKYYNEKYADLIKAYQGNLEDAYPIIKELEELDPDPNDAAAQSLKLAKETAGFVYNNNRFIMIMDRAAELLEIDRYYEAIGVYTTGFDLSRDIFEDEGYGNIIEAIVQRLVDILQESVSQTLVIGGGLDASVEELLLAVQQNEPAEAALEKFLERAAGINDRRELLDRLAEEFLGTEADIRAQRADEKQVYYLVFMDRLLEGRSDTGSPEGILYSLEQVWTDRMTRTETALWEKLEQLYKEAGTAYASADFDTLGNSAENLRRYADLCARMVSSWSRGVYANGTLELSSFAGNIVEEKLPLFRAALLFRETAEGFSALADLKKTTLELLDDLSEVESIEAVEELMGSLVGVEASLARLRSEWQRKGEDIALYEEGPGDFSRSAELVTDILDGVDAEALEIGGLRLASVNRKAEIQIEPLKSEYRSTVEEIDLAVGYLEGVVETKGEGEQAAEVVYHYPDRTIEICRKADGVFRRMIEDIGTVTDFLERQDPAIQQEEIILRKTAEKDELAELVKTQMERVAGLSVEAEEKIFLAARYRQEGEQRLEEARRLMARNQFAAAKERLVAAAERFDESLFYQEDPELRTIRDDRIAALYSQISDAENALVIREVREYIIEGKSLYSQGEFGQAQNILLRAENRWRDTNVEVNPEIEYWLSLTQTALSVTSGREIDETDPLYAEMSQYLNQARADYRAGKKLIEENKKPDADFYLNRAEKNILYVQQYFPFNKEARVLNLLISQIRDEKQFLELFKKDFTEARQLISTNPQKAYIDLKDLQTIDPNYPGMAQAILEAEYAAGIKIRPPDRTKINQAAKLYDDAYRIYTTGSRAQYPLALSLLDEAIRLNPDNIAAIRLKDNISVETGGQSTSVFSNEDQQVYLEAVNAFTAGNYLKASILVDILLQNPDNQRNTKLLELQERIETVR